MVGEFFSTIFKYVFGEKNISNISFIIAVIMTVILSAIVPSHVTDIFPFGEANIYIFYIVLCMLIWVLLLLVIWGFDRLKEKNEQLNYKKEEEKEGLKELWSYIDSLSPYDYKLVISFIKSNNQPKTISGHRITGILITNKVVSMQSEKRIKPEQDGPAINRFILDVPKQAGKYIYKLEEDFYKLLKYSCEKHNKICNLKNIE